jgi:hypothetical protein
MIPMKTFHFLVLAAGLAISGVHIAEGYFLVPSHGQISATNQGPWLGPVSSVASVPVLSDPALQDAVNEVKEANKPDQYEKQVHSSHKPRYPFINACHERLEKVFGRYTNNPFHDWKLWVGTFLWLSVWAKWMKYGYDEIYYQRFLFAFGINVLILHHLQFADTIELGMIDIAIVLAAQATLQSIFMFREEHKQLEGGCEKFTCETLYLDLTLPPEQILVLFVAQFCVWWFYMTSIIHNFDFNHVNYMYWVVAFMAMQMTMIFNRGDDSVLGKPFPCHEVYRLATDSGKIKVHVIDEDGAAIKGVVPFRISKADLLMRGIFGYWVNAICREIMAYTIPLMLMGFEQPMDFVVYCVGVNFICTLDDMSTKDFALKVTHHLAVGDLVVAKKVAYGHLDASPRTPRSKAIDSPWFAGTVTAIDTKTLTCSVRYEDGTEDSGVGDHDLYYAPERDPKWGTGEFSDAHLLPDIVHPVKIKAGTE